MANALVGRVDGVVGDGIEAAVKLKHRRRLRRLGWERLFAPSGPGVFAGGEPAPRAGCSLEVLIDGANAFPLMAEAISQAKRFIHISGWHVAPAFELEPGRPQGAIGVLLGAMAQDVDVRVLVWSGSPLPAFHPTRGEVAQALENLTHRTRIQAHGDPREHPLHCHHEKTIVIDGQVAFVGGMDLTDSAGDRYDSQAHQARRRLGWHDVATRLHGPVVADVNDHFRLRWRELTGEDLPALEPPPAAGRSTVQVVRTVAEGMYDEVPHGDFRVFESYTRALRSAENLIYLENQFLWAPELVDILADKLRHPPTPDFRIVVLLPAKANNGAEDTRGQTGMLIDADGGNGQRRWELVKSLQVVGNGRGHAKILRGRARRQRPALSRRPSARTGVPAAWPSGVTPPAARAADASVARPTGTAPAGRGRSGASARRRATPATRRAGRPRRIRGARPTAGSGSRGRGRRRR